MDDRSILLRLAEAGKPAPRLRLDGPAPEKFSSARDRYELIGEIARGGVGVVHRARDTDLCRDVALKVLRDEHVSDPEIVRRFVEEAQIGGQLQHPGIVPVLELGVREGRQPFFAMKLVKGQTLAAALAARADLAADRRKLLGVFAQACHTVAYAHARGVIHRDLKPSNVMIGGFGEVQVVDWGFAKVLKTGGVDDERRARRDTTIIATVRSATEGSASVAGSVMGTPAYMPPEQALGHVEDLNERADVFALGAILCEILTGKPAYTGTANEQLLAASQGRLEDAHARLDRCGADGELVALAKRAMSPLPKDRPATGRELADAVTDHLAAAERRAHEARVVAAKQRVELERQQRIRRLTLAVASAVLGLVVLGGGAHQWLAREAAQRERRREAAIEAALQEAEREGASGDYAKAVAAAERARDLGGGAGAETRAEELRQARDAADTAAKRRADDEALLAALDETCAAWTFVLDAKAVDGDCVAALAKHGLDLSRPETIIDRLAASHVAPELASNLDAWASMRFRTKGDWKPLDDLARAIDPDDANDAIRDARVTKDVEVLRQRLARADVEQLPPNTLAMLGGALAAAGDKERALSLFRRARDLHPDSWRLQSSLWGVLPRGAPEASRGCAAAVALRPRSATLRNNLGHVLEQGDQEGALAAFRDAIRLDPKMAPAHHNIALMLAKRGEHTTAIAGYREALRHWPDFAEAHSNLGCSLLETGDVEGAIREFHEALRINPDSPMPHVGLSAMWIRRGQPDEAIAECERAIAIDPDVAPAYINLGAALKDKGNLEGALAAYRKCVGLDPENPQVHKDFGVVLLMSGARDEALAACREAVRLKPDFAEGHCQVGNTLLERGDRDGAIDAYREAIRVDPNWAVAHNNLGFVLRAQGRFDEALGAFQEAARVKPDYADAHFGIGTVLQRKGHLVDAIAAYREAIRLRPAYPVALNNLGNALAANGEMDASIAAYREAIRIRPDYAVAYRNLGMRLHDNGDVQGAVAAWREAVRLQPNLVEAHADLGRACLLDGDLEGAVAELREAVRLGPGYPEAHLNLGIALAQQGRYQEAVVHLRKADEIGSTRPGWNEPSRAWLDRIVPLAECEARLPALLNGTATPRDAKERAGFAQVCIAQRLYAPAARLYAEALAEEPALADDLVEQHRYRAACAAAASGEPQGRARALEWLRTDLSARLERDRDLARTLSKWRRDRELATVRDAIDALPEAEREGWRKLWSDVDAALAAALTPAGR